jgi:hypothetical protein
MAALSDFIAHGVVSRTFSDQESYDVTTDDGETLPNAVFGAGFAAGLLGYKARGRLAQGTRVSVVKSTPAIIFACHGSVPPDPGSANLFRTTSRSPVDIQTNFADEQGDGSNLGSRLPSDLLEGEFAIDNLLGVGVHFLTTMAKLQAGERAKVEVGLMDDLVRIVSGTFKHHSSMGDTEVYNDGSLNSVQHATSYPHEAAGVLENKSPRGAAQDGVVQETPIAPTGRWRYSHYLGYLGDFMHFFITDPVEGLAQLAQERAGKLHIHAGLDGGLLVRSVADITFERVSRIVVPVEQKAHFDPTGKTAEEFATPPAGFLTTWTFDPKQPWKAAYYLRDYARWLSSSHAYARFLQNDKDWRVGAASSAPVPSYGNQEQDRENSNSKQNKEVRETYSTFRLLRDGSYVVLDGYGSSYMMAGGDVNLSAARHLRLEAGGNISVLAGNSIFVKARKHVEITSVTGALLLKSRQRLHALCEQGTLLFRTLMAAGDGQDGAHRFVDNTVGVVISSPNASIMTSTTMNLTLEGQGKSPKDGQPNGVIIQASGADITLRTNREGAVKVLAGRILRRATTFFDNATSQWTILSPAFSLSGSLRYAAGQLYTRSLNAVTFRAKSIASSQELTGSATGERGAPPHQNHIQFIKDGSVTDMPTDDDGTKDAVEDLGKTTYAPTNPAANAVRPVFTFLPPEEYRAADQTQLYDQSLAQQIASGASEHPAGFNYNPWDFTGDALLGEDSSGDNLPFPGKSARMYDYPSDAVLHRIDATAPADIKPSPKETAKASAFTFFTCDLDT